MQKPFVTLINSKPFFWVLLALPSLPLLADLGTGDRYYAEIMYESGILSVQFLVLALSLTPLVSLFGHVPYLGKSLRWLLVRRRAIGLTSFGYGALHTLFYVREIGSAELVLLDLNEKELLVGWVAFFVMLALATTSNQLSVRALHRYWKPLQRGAYWAAGLIGLHWFWIGQFQAEMLKWFAPLAALQIIRVSKKLAK